MIFFAQLFFVSPNFFWSYEVSPPDSGAKKCTTLVTTGSNLQRAANLPSRPCISSEPLQCHLASSRHCDPPVIFGGRRRDHNTTLQDVCVKLLHQECLGALPSRSNNKPCPHVRIPHEHVFQGSEANMSNCATTCAHRPFPLMLEPLDSSKTHVTTSLSHD